VSYSFSVKGTTKADAVTAANAKFDEVLAAQSNHAVDMPAAREAAEKFVGLLADDTTRDTTLSVNGSVYTTAEGLQQVQITVSAGFDAPRAS
jgi:hypothetical protein